MGLIERLKADLSSLRLDLAFARALLEFKYSADQPRVPAGSSDGGQWSGGGPTLATMDDGVLHSWSSEDGLQPLEVAARNSGPPWNVDLQAESKPFGPGHATDHIAISNADLYRRLSDERLDTPDFTFFGDREGSFDRWAQPTNTPTMC